MKNVFKSSSLHKKMCFQFFSSLKSQKLKVLKK